MKVQWHQLGVNNSSCRAQLPDGTLDLESQLWFYKWSPSSLLPGLWIALPTPPVQGKKCSTLTRHILFLPCQGTDLKGDSTQNICLSCSLQTQFGENMAFHSEDQGHGLMFPFSSQAAVFLSQVKSHQALCEGSWSLFPKLSYFTDFIKCLMCTWKKQI